MKKIIYLPYILSLFFLISSSFAQDQSPVVSVQDDNKDQRFFGVFTPGFTAVSGPAGSISGLKIGMEAGYAVTPKWSLGLGIDHGLSTSGLSSVYTSISMKAQYALSGSFYVKSSSASVDSKKVITIEDIKPGGFRAAFGYSQLFFNGTIDIIAFSGITAGLLYDWESNTNLQYGAGFGFGYHSNGVATVTPIHAFMRMVLWF